MRHTKGEDQDLLISNISKVEFSTKFKNWASNLHENKADYLHFLVIVERLLMKDIAENEYSEEYLKKLDNSLLTLENLIMNA